MELLLVDAADGRNPRPGTDDGCSMFVEPLNFCEWSHVALSTFALSSFPSNPVNTSSTLPGSALGDLVIVNVTSSRDLTQKIHMDLCEWSQVAFPSFSCNPMNTS